MSEVFVSTVHPAIGRLYWVFTSNADCNYPDHYSLTDWSELATRFPKGWRDHDYYHWLHRSHISKVFEPVRSTRSLRSSMSVTPTQVPVRSSLTLSPCPSRTTMEATRSGRRSASGTRLIAAATGKPFTSMRCFSTLITRSSRQRLPSTLMRICTASWVSSSNVKSGRNQALPQSPRL